MTPSSDSPPGTSIVDDTHRFDLEPLTRWWRENLGPVRKEGLAIRKFSGGQSNPTFWIADETRGYVLRKKPPGKLLPKAHMIEREYRVMAALADSGVPVPRVFTLCEDESVIGTPFFVMEHVYGRGFWDVRMPGSSASERRAIYDEFARVLAAIHAVDVQAAGLGDYGRPQGYLARQIKLWTKQYRACETRVVPAMEALVRWLPEQDPGPDEVALVHGDYRLDNLLFAPDGPRCVAVLDWELSTLGHPLADLAYAVMAYEVELPNVGGLAGRDLAACGIPDEATFLRRYEHLAGRDIGPAWPLFKAFSLFRFAAISQGVYKRGLDGNAASDKASIYGAAVAELSAAGCRVAGLSID
jgi:aminoglycoside phosphotransferase (APT) family kinase protein